ncbi:tripartite tricarboxylate transporter permease [Jiella sonneratiae]|uniref:Tripartite tricarboxylate transporter permease n=1 Tax=Jiella sonneratiae TaxID=2816856 RepID=A0ABS3J305_9HYPH|nr:tripartite tricarboxylate transporter permease [Jiella sonneratiae]MBO0904055.1 tripartite tricarboxylate transporter permease [Jiella sonneratiae]
MLEGLLAAISPTALFMEIVGVVIGIIFGAIPGLTATLAIALFVPVTFLMSAENGMIMLGGIYAGAIFGGSISAILVDVPGTPASIVTGWEGHAMAREGRAPWALGTAALASGTGGVISALALMFLTPPLASFALTFGPPEYCALLLFSFAVVVVMMETPLLRSLLSAALGLLIATIGLDPVMGAARFTFGEVHLYSGFNMVAVLIGFFCMNQAVYLAFESLGETEGPAIDFGGENSSLALLKTLVVQPFTYLRSSVIGIFLGILPAVGPVTTPFVAHALERRFNAKDEKYGKGSTAGLIAAEASNSANVGGSLVPLISLGIPGSGAAAVFIGALTLHGLQPGPLLFVNQPVLIYTFFWGFVAINLFMMVFGLYGARYFAVVLKLPQSMLATFIAVFSILGAFAIDNSLFDVGVMLGATAVAIWFRALKIPILPIVMAMILGPLFEQQAVVLATTSESLGNVLARPIADVFLAITVAMVVYAVFKRRTGGSAVPMG